MYSEQGFEALMRAVLAEVCQSLTVVSNCRPGSPHSQAAWAIRPPQLARLLGVDRRARRAPPASTRRRSLRTASMKSSVTRTELFEFWKKTDLYASPSNEPS